MKLIVFIFLASMIVWLDSHKCPPKWEVCRPEYGDEDDPDFSYGEDQEEAITNYCDNRFSDWEYPQMIKVWIRANEDSEWEKFMVEVHSVPEFEVYKDA
jgi:hypothetical protein